MFIYYPRSNIVRLRFFIVGDLEGETMISVLLTLLIKFVDDAMFPGCATFDVLKDEVIGNRDRPSWYRSLQK